MSKLPSYCWDTTVFVAWLAEDQSAPLADIAAVVEEIELKKANLIVPVITYSEILEAHHAADQMERFQLFLKRSNVILVDTSMQLAQKAGQIRSACLGLKPVRKIKTPDATFIAAAILYQADVFHVG